MLNMSGDYRHIAKEGLVVAAGLALAAVYPEKRFVITLGTLAILAAAVILSKKSDDSKTPIPLNQFSFPPQPPAPPGGSAIAIKIKLPTQSTLIAVSQSLSSTIWRAIGYRVERFAAPIFARLQID